MPRPHDHPQPASQMNGISDEHHDFIWARLPFLVPIAAKIAQTCGGTGQACFELAQLVERLRSVLLGHLDREEKLLSRIRTSADDQLIIAQVDELRREHRDVQDLLERVCDSAGLPHMPPAHACPTVHAFYEELTGIARYVRSQIQVEDEILGRVAGQTAR